MQAAAVAVVAGGLQRGSPARLLYWRPSHPASIGPCCTALPSLNGLPRQAAARVLTGIACCLCLKQRPAPTRSPPRPCPPCLQGTLKRLGVNTIPGIEEVLLINADGSALQFTNPKVQASIAANTYVVSGASQHKRECAAPPAKRGSAGLTTNSQRLASPQAG